jgi:hypothetical protein
MDKPWRIYGAYGEGARSYCLNAGMPADDTTNTPTGFVVTAAGTSPVTVGQVKGYPLLVTTGGTEYNGSNVQLRGETVKLESGVEAYFRFKGLVSEEKTCDLLVGLCELKTDLLKNSIAHGVLATNVEGVFFFKVSGASETTIYLKTYKDGTETGSVAVGTLTKTAVIDLALWWDGSKIHAYVGDVEKAVVAGTLPDGELTPSIAFKTGAAAAITLSVAELALAVV